MSNPCFSPDRCRLTSCAACCWRYCLGVSRCILSHHPTRLYAVTIAAALRDPTDFRRWRTACRNLLDYRRRKCRWWGSVGVWAWLGRDGAVRGIAHLGSITETEFLTAFARRWPMTVRSIETASVREEVYFAIRPGVIVSPAPASGRYQSIKIAIAPALRPRL